MIFYVRTNLSTLIIYPRLIFILSKYKNSKIPFYKGVYCNNVTFDNSFVGGFGIILNNQCNNILLNDAFKDDYYNSDTPDDVLIGKILGKNNIKCTSNDYYYQYNNSLSFKENCLAINQNSDYIFIRLTNHSEINPINTELFGELNNIYNKY